MRLRALWLVIASACILTRVSCVPEAPKKALDPHKTTTSVYSIGSYCGGVYSLNPYDRFGLTTSECRRKCEAAQLCEFFTSVPSRAPVSTGRDCLLYSKCPSHHVYHCHGCDAKTYKLHRKPLTSASPFVRSVHAVNRLKTVKAVAAKENNYPFPVDVVFTWVNSSDPLWQASMSRFLKRQHRPATSHKASHTDGTSLNRFLDHDELKHSMRSIERFAPWVRHIYIVVSSAKGQWPSWLSKNNSRVSVVTHSQIFPASEQQALPTFDSSAIECYIDRIPGLSEQFLYLNDDMMFTDLLYKWDFFTATGQPKVAFQTRFGRHFCNETLWGSRAKQAYMWHAINLNCALDLHFHQARRYQPLHQAYPLTKTIMQTMRKLYPSLVATTIAQRFRNKLGVCPHYLAMWTAIYQHHAVRASPTNSPSHYILPYYGHEVFDHGAFAKFYKLRPKLLCLNDFTASNTDTGDMKESYTFLRRHQKKLRLGPWDQPNMTALNLEMTRLYNFVVPDPADWEVKQTNLDSKGASQHAIDEVHALNKRLRTHG